MTGEPMRKTSILVILVIILSLGVGVFRPMPVKAATKTVYVISQIKEPYAHTVPRKLSYDKNGLLKSGSDYNESGEVGRPEWVYDSKKRLVKYDNHFMMANWRRERDTCAYKKDGSISTCTHEEEIYDDHAEIKGVFSISYDKKGRVNGFKTKSGSTYSESGSIKYNKKNYPSKVTTKRGTETDVSEYYYDENGYITKFIYNGKSTEFQNSLDSKGRLIKKTYPNWDGEMISAEYQYKAIKVDKKYLKTVKGQQRALINNLSICEGDLMGLIIFSGHRKN